jgi:leucyl/phenylalanyl-tRNA--protein transferase
MTDDFPGLSMATDFFLDPADADAEGLVGVGGGLSTARLLEAYRRGIFPHYNDTLPVLWWSPDPRAILELDGMHVARRLARTIRSGKFRVSFDEDFEGVIDGCADRVEGTWITPEMRAAYVELHRLGHAHSAEVWHEGRLAGGVYGVAVGALFAGESMFTRVSDASKVALFHLLERLRARHFQLFDVQYVTEHTGRLGAIEISRSQYLARLRRAIRARVSFA